MNKLNFRFFAIVFGIWIADFFSKIAAEKALLGGEIIPLIGDLLQFRLVYNTGGVFGILQNNAIFFHIMTGIAIIALITYFIKTKEDHIIFQIAISFILGGAFGNFTDRFFRIGVVDFIDMGIGANRFPTYNIADTFITFGAILLAITFFFLTNEKASNTEKGSNQ